MTGRDHGGTAGGAGRAPTAAAEFVDSLAGRWPEVLPHEAPDDDLERACRYLAPRLDPDGVVAAAATVGVATGAASVVLLAVLLSAVSPVPAVPVAVAVGGTIGWATYRAGRRLPVALAAAARTRAVADATTVVGSLALSLRLVPVPERAVRFAAAAGDRPLHRSLLRHGERAEIRGDDDAGLSAFGAEWAPWFPALDRSVALLADAVEAPSGADRERLLDRAVAAVESDLRDRTASFAGDLRGPVTGLYAFGVLLPLALVGTLPAAVAAGVPIPPAVFVATYDLLLPAGLVVAAGSLLLRRPVAFPAPRVGRSHPDVPDRRAHAVAAGVAAAVAGWLLATVVLGEWAGPVLATGLGVGTGLVVVLRARREVRRRVDDRDRGLADALALLGRRVADGRSVERALPVVADRLSGPVGDALGEASRRRASLGVTVSEALSGDGGPFGPDRAVGPRSAAAVAALTAAVSEGRPAGAALVDHADRLDTLAESERAARRELATVTSTLGDTAALFGPLVGGATVALAGRLTGLGGSAGGTAGTAGAAGMGAADAAGTALPVALVGPAVGGYVLALAAILTALATGLERGLDATVVGYRVGVALIAASGAFVVGHLAVASLVG